MGPGRHLRHLPQRGFPVGGRDALVSQRQPVLSGLQFAQHIRMRRAEAGVAAPLPGVIGAMMAMEAVKHISGAGQTLRGRLMIHDALFAETRVIAVKRRSDCEVCGANS